MNYNDYINSSEPNEEFKEKTKLKVASAVSAQRSRRKRTLAGLVAVFAIVAVAGTSFMLKDRIKSDERNEITQEQVTVRTATTEAAKKANNIADNQKVNEKEVEKPTEAEVEKIAEEEISTFYDPYNEEKADCSVPEDKIFADDCVIVSFKKAASGFRKEHTPEEFPGVEIEYMKDLSDGGEAPENKDNYHQIYAIYLKNKGRENVLNAVETIAKLDYIQHVSPNYIDKAELF